MIEIGRSHPISTDDALSPHAESFAAANQLSPANLIATSLVIHDGVRRSAVYASFDGGETWRRSSEESAVQFDGGDPIVYFDQRGTAFFARSRPEPFP